MPEAIVTDLLRSYGGAICELGLSTRSEQGQRQNIRAENAHQPTGRRVRGIQRFRSPGSALRFLSAHAAVDNPCNVERHLISRKSLKLLRAVAINGITQTGDKRRLRSMVGATALG
jgi:putative transposase